MPCAGNFCIVLYSQSDFLVVFQINDFAYRCAMSILKIRLCLGDFLWQNNGIMPQRLKDTKDSKFCFDIPFKAKDY